MSMLKNLRLKAKAALDLDLVERRMVQAARVMTKRKRKRVSGLGSVAKVMLTLTSNLKEMLTLISQILKLKSKPTNQIST